MGSVTLRGMCIYCTAPIERFVEDGDKLKEASVLLTSVCKKCEREANDVT